MEKMQKQKKLAIRLLNGVLWLNVLMICLMILLAGCTQNMTDSFCLIYKPVSGVAKIKPDTQRIAVKRNNLKYEELCE